MIDGESASFVKRGYIIDPWTSITVDGWRTSQESVAAFRFSAMEESYADRKGQGRNVGVVGFAFFHERGGPSWQDLQRRDNADPFPSRFSQPPPARRWRSRHGEFALRPRAVEPRARRLVLRLYGHDHQ